MSEFVKALAAAQAEMGNAAYNRVNPHFKSKYADFAAVREATLPILNRHGFAIIQTTEDGFAGLTLKTELAHSSGDSRFSYYPIAGGTPQQQGSALTYARRYSWSAITGIASEEDDDGNQASAPPPRNASQVRKSGEYPEFEKEMRFAATEDALKKLWVKWWPTIQSWPAKHQETAQDEKERAKARLGIKDGDVENVR